MLLVLALRLHKDLEMYAAKVAFTRRKSFRQARLAPSCASRAKPATKSGVTIARIVSGGQTGGDRGGLDAAIWYKLPHGGWCPKGRRAEDGVIPARYQLQETKSKDYLARTEANVVDSDATLIFSYGDLEGGSLKTAEFAKKHGKPWLHVDLSKSNRQQAVDAVVQWLKSSCPAECVLNVAGSRESKSPGIRGVVKARLIDVISQANGTLFYPIEDDAPSDDEDYGAFAVTHSAGDEELTELLRKSRQEAEAIPMYHPKTIAEAVKIVLDALSPEAKAEFRQSSDKEEFCLDCHFGIALWIRNAMIHRNENIVDLYADVQKGCREGRWDGYPEADSVSGVIVGLVWDALHGS